MKLIALILGLILERTATRLLSLREPRGLDGYFDRCFRLLQQRQGIAAFLLTVLIVIIPVLPVVLLMVALGDALMGFLAVGFAAVILVFSLGPRDLTREVDDYLIAMETGDEEASRRLAKELVEADLAGSQGRRVLAVEEAVLAQANNRIFGVIFWFMLLGPSGAWLFRVADLMRRRAVFEAMRGRAAEGSDPGYLHAVQSVYGLLAWLPARLLALSYAMAGSFEDAMSDWRGYYDKCSDKFFHVNDEILACAGRGAIGSIAAEGGVNVEPVRAAMRLISRTLLIWVTAISLLTVFGYAI
ncbi:MAG: regulatory signaling modulator protein AmpE [Gammaproteobacteria bacterium]